MNDKRNVLVTGAGGGIGRGIAEVLAARDWHVLVNDIDAEAARRTAVAIGGTAVPGNVAADPEGIAQAARVAAGPIHGLVNNAGIIRRVPLDSIDAATIDETLAVNLRAMMLLSRALLPDLAATRGAIVNLASIAAYVTQLAGGAYGPSKAAVVSFTQQAAVEWGPRGVRVNAIAPGMIRTAMAEAVYADATLHARRRALVPLGRIGDPADIGRPVAFLLSEDASYVSGVTITVDGALSHTLMAHIPQPSDVA